MNSLVQHQQRAPICKLAAQNDDCVCLMRQAQNTHCYERDATSGDKENAKSQHSEAIALSRFLDYGKKGCGAEPESQPRDKWAVALLGTGLNPASSRVRNLLGIAFSRYEFAGRPNAERLLLRPSNA